MRKIQMVANDGEEEEEEKNDDDVYVLGAGFYIISDIN
jgi:hypothetical protein